MEQNERDKMIVDNIGIVHMILRQLHVPAAQYEDCLQEGIIGLIEAVDKFDETKGFQFSTFAYYDIIGKIGTYLRDKSKVVRLPRRIYVAKCQYVKLHGKGLDDKEIREQLDVNDYEWSQVVDEVLSLDYENDDDINTYNYIGSCDEHIELFYYDVELALNKILADATDTQRDVYEEHIYSILYDEAVTQQYLADKYGISQVTVSRIITKYNEQLRKELHYERT